MLAVRRFRSPAATQIPLRIDLRLRPQHKAVTFEVLFSSRSMTVYAQKQPRTRYYLGGKLHETRAFVLGSGKQYRRPKSLPPLIGALTAAFAEYAPSSRALAVLMPVK